MTKAIDVLTDDDVAAMFETRLEEMNQFRRALREYDATGISSNSTRFPERDFDWDGEMVEIPEDSEYPVASASYGEQVMYYHRAGFIWTISDQAASDSMLPLEVDSMEEAMLEEARRLDRIAYNLLADNTNDDGPVSNSNGDFEVIVDAVSAMMERGHSQNNLLGIVSPNVFGQLAKDDTLNRATDDGDALARNGQLGTVYGTTLVASNQGFLGPDEGFLVDTSRFGYEGTRRARETSSEYDFDHDRTKYKIRERKGFLAQNAGSNFELDFSGA